MLYIYLFYRLSFRASDQSAVYAEVIDQAICRTPVAPHTIAHNDHDIPEDHCHT